MQVQNDRRKFSQIFTFFIFFSLSLAHEYNPSGWATASGWIKETLNESVDPCENFAEFACGKFTEKFPHFFGSSEHERTNGILAENIKKTLAKIRVNDEKTENFKKYMKTFYDQCTSRPEYGNLEENRILIREIYDNLATYIMPHIVEKEEGGGEKYPWENSTDFQFWKFTGILQRVLGSPFLFEAEVLPAAIGCKKNIPALHLRPAAVTSFGDDFMDYLLSYVLTYHNTSQSDEEIADTKRQITDFKNDLFEHVDNYVNTENLWYVDVAYSKPIKYSNLKRKYPQINWDGYLNGLLPAKIYADYLSSDPTVVLEYEQYYHNLSKIIEKHSYLGATNYGFVSTIQRYMQFFMSGKIKTQDRRDLAEANVFEGDPCLDVIVRYFSPAILRSLCEEYGVKVEDWQKDIILIKSNVFAAFRFLINSMNWISSDEKLVLIEKLDHMNFYGDIPSWIKNDNAVNDKTPKYDKTRSLVANDIVAQKELFEQQVTSLISAEMDEAPPIFWGNAWNDVRGVGSIRFLVGFMLPPIYSYKYPLTIKYGSTGVLIAHEMMHSFGTFLYREEAGYPKTYPSLYKADRLALENSTFQEIRSRVECLLPYYNPRCAKQTKDAKQWCYHGKRTIEENVADTEGIKVAYTAYKFTTQTMGSEPALHDLTEYTADQLFFMAFARRMCAGKGRMDASGSHSSPRDRIEQPLLNLPSFARAFNCTGGKRFARKEVCSIYGDAVF